MSDHSFSQLIAEQREFAKNGISQTLIFRVAVLGMLENALKAKQDQITSALGQATGKSADKAFADELAPIFAEIRSFRTHLRWWNLPLRFALPFGWFEHPRQIGHIPFGVCCVISGPDFPFRSAIFPLIAATMAGNSVLVLVNDGAPSVAQIILDMINEYYTPDYLCAVSGNEDQIAELIAAKPDLVFYAGLNAPKPDWIGKAREWGISFVQEKRALNLAWVLAGADLSKTAQLLAMQKYSQRGRDIRSPDLILVEADQFDQFLTLMTSEAEKYLPPEAKVASLFVPIELSCLGNWRKTSFGIDIMIAASPIQADTIQQLQAFGELGIVYVFGGSATTKGQIIDNLDYIELADNRLSDNWTRLLGKAGFSTFSLPQYK